jgi:hypothetical protein
MRNCISSWTNGFGDGARRGLTGGFTASDANWKVNNPVRCLEMTRRIPYNVVPIDTNVIAKCRVRQLNVGMGWLASKLASGSPEAGMAVFMLNFIRLVGPSVPAPSAVRSLPTAGYAKSHP